MYNEKTRIRFSHELFKLSSFVLFVRTSNIILILFILFRRFYHGKASFRVGHRSQGVNQRFNLADQIFFPYHSGREAATNKEGEEVFWLEILERQAICMSRASLSSSALPLCASSSFSPSVLPHRAATSDGSRQLLSRGITNKS